MENVPSNNQMQADEVRASPAVAQPSQLILVFGGLDITKVQGHNR